MKDVSILFNKFAGRKLTLSEQDPTIQAMDKVAAANGLEIRFIMPNGLATDDLIPNRVNVHLERGSSGQYRVRPNDNFHLG